MLGFLFVCFWNLASAAENVALNTLTAIHYQTLPNNRMQINLQFLNALQGVPKSFVTKDPPRLVLDFSSTGLKMAKTSDTIGQGMALRYETVESKGRTRVVIDLKQAVNYRVELQKNTAVIFLAGAAIDAKRSDTENFSLDESKHAPLHQLLSLDFRRTQEKGGQILLNLSDTKTEVDIQRESGDILLSLLDTQLPSALHKRFDVSDFGTPVDSVEVGSQGRNTTLRIKAHGHYQHLAYQVNHRFILEIDPVSEEQANRTGMATTTYSGERISLNFQNISIRAVLQLLAEFTSINIVTSDSVSGNTTLRLNNVPWDQALDIILRSRGLAKRQYGNVMMIAPSEEVTERERSELRAQNTIEELSPLHSELIQINYANAADISALLRSQGTSLLSTRGQISVDARTNTLWVQDTSDKLREIRDLILRLDIPIKQVMIEARVVNVDKTYEQELGLRFGVSHPNHISGSLTGANSMMGGTAASDVTFTDRLNINLPATDSSASRFGIALARIGSQALLDLELSAMESSGRGNVISTPRLITANQHAAKIESGEEIPYQQATSSGATSVAFKKAVLSLSVTHKSLPTIKLCLPFR